MSVLHDDNKSTALVYESITYVTYVLIWRELNWAVA